MSDSMVLALASASFRFSSVSANPNERLNLFPKYLQRSLNRFLKFSTTTLPLDALEVILVGLLVFMGIFIWVSNFCTLL